MAQTLSDQAVLMVGDSQAALKGWTQVRVTRGIERLPSDFSFGMTERFSQGQSVAVSAGDRFQLLLGGDLIMTGYVDTVTSQFEAQSHTVAIAGRSKCADLVD